MAPEPQQRAQRSAAPAAAPGRQVPARPGTARPQPAPARSQQPQARGQQPAARAQQAAARPAQSRPAPGRDTGEFARLVQRNTVDVRDQRRGRKKRNPAAGKIALGMAVVSAAVDASAFAVFMGGDTDFAFGICFVVVFLTLIAAVLGFVAAVGSFGRWYGAVGVVVAFFANPVILIVLLVFVAPEVLTDMGGTAGSGT